MYKVQIKEHVSLRITPIQVDNYPSPMKTANTRMNGDAKVDSVSQCTLDMFPHPWVGKIDISELLKPPEKNSGSIHHIRTRGQYWVTVPHPWGLG